MDYSWISEMAEQRVDEMMSTMTPEEALKNDVVTAMEIMLETAGIKQFGMEPLFDATEEEKIRKVIKVKDNLARLMETALRTTNVHGLSNARFVFGDYKACMRYLEGER